MSEHVDGLLAETELNGDPVLRELLDRIESEATAVRPMPSAELSALMHMTPVAPGRARRGSLAGRGGIVTGVALIGVLGLGAASAAASPEVRSAIGAGIAAVAHVFEPAAPSPRPSEGGRPATAPPAPTATVAAVAPSPSESPTGGPADQAGSAAGDQDAPGGKTAPGAQKGRGNGNGDQGGASDQGGRGDQNGRGNGKGNQSGHGNGRGKGNGGPAPAP